LLHHFIKSPLLFSTDEKKTLLHAAQIMAVIREEEKDDASSLDISALSEDPDLIRQVQHSREDREQGRVYGREGGLEYLQAKVKEFEHRQNAWTLSEHGI
jgi:hypothetical protein